MDARLILARKPRLYHYTNADAVLKILESRALLARPTWDFEDTQEYVLGLGIIAHHLKQIRGSGFQQWPPLLLALLSHFRIGIDTLVDRVIAHIEYEFAHHSKPNVEVYVACVTENFQSPSMSSEYGEFLVQFNWMLPLLSYAVPRPFNLSMLSRVTYDEAEFRRFIVIMGFAFSGSVYEELRQYYGAFEASDRLESLAATVAIHLCSFATNIKHPDFSYEREWRLKTIRSNHLPRTPLADQGSHLRQAFFGLPADATYSVTPPGRLVQGLSFQGRFIIEGNIGMHVRPSTPPDAATKLAETMHQARLLGPYVGPARELREQVLKAARDGVPWFVQAGLY